MGYLFSAHHACRNSVLALNTKNVIRHFTKTRTYLQSGLKAFELREYNKVEDNTFYNLTSFLQKKYSARGHRTLFTEDMQKYVILNYNRRGLLHSPRASFTYNVLNYEGYAKSPSYDLLQIIHNSSTLKRSIMTFYSDHGVRFVKIRTLLGKIEERKLFDFLTIPE
ncbi:uncharacterized protein LOC143254453 [Tachypleus tridentatus]|uniref:uncharacterized protein LOC143254453 n=1 Tax=Tachypleus tridentatus TaxID=6853 RepID=UPI003FCF4EFD